MSDMATITSKRQLTIPVRLFKKLSLKEGQKVVVSEEKGKLTISPALQLVRQLAGSVSVPVDLKGKNTDEAVRMAKAAYFSREK